MVGTRIGGRGVLRGLIADVQPLWQNTLATSLLRLGFGSVALCDSPDELPALVTRTRPHLVLIDPDGFADASDLAGLVVVVSARPEARIAGTEATAHVSKCRRGFEIEQSLRSVVEQHLDWATLTKRELEIIGLVAKEMSNRAIGTTLWLSAQTVKFHLAQAYRKLGVCDRRAAVERVRELGLLADEPRPQLVDELLGSVRTVLASKSP